MEIGGGDGANPTITEEVGPPRGIAPVVSDGFVGAHGHVAGDNISETDLLAMLILFGKEFSLTLFRLALLVEGFRFTFSFEVSKLPHPTIDRQSYVPNSFSVCKNTGK